MGKKAKKDKGGKKLLLQAAAQLGVTYQKGQVLGDLIRGEADRIVRQSAASVSADPDLDAAQWRGIGRSRRDLVPMQQDRMIELVNWLTSSNMLGKRIRELRRDFVIGEGMKFEAEDEQIQMLLDTMYKDPVNQFGQYQFQIVDYLGINGEVILPTFVNEIDGSVRFGWIDPIELEQVVADRMNRRIMRAFVLKKSAAWDMSGGDSYDSQTKKRVFTIANTDLDPASVSYNYRTGEALFFRINCAPDARRGRSDFEALADYIDMWDQSMFTNLEREQLLNRFIWDVKLTGKSEADIEKWVSTQGEPQAGSIRAHNENVEWKAESPDLKSADTQTMSKGTRNDVLGGAGLGAFFWGDTENSNRASSENLELPILKGLTSRQLYLKNMFGEIAQYCIDQRALADQVFRYRLESGAISREVDVKMPEISVKDMSRIGTVMSAVVAALDQATANEWVTKVTAASAFASIVAQLGIVYDVNKELEEAAKEAAAAAIKDYTKGVTKEPMRKLAAVG